jgi:hypothetical protein
MLEWGSGRRVPVYGLGFFVVSGTCDVDLASKSGDPNENGNGLAGRFAVLGGTTDAPKMVAEGGAADALASVAFGASILGAGTITAPSMDKGVEPPAIGEGALGYGERASLIVSALCPYHSIHVTRGAFVMRCALAPNVVKRMGFRPLLRRTERR